MYPKSVITHRTVSVVIGCHGKQVKITPIIKKVTSTKRFGFIGAIMNKRNPIWYFLNTLLKEYYGMVCYDE